MKKPYQRRGYYAVAHSWALRRKWRRAFTQGEQTVVRPLFTAMPEQDGSVARALTEDDLKRAVDLFKARYEFAHVATEKGDAFLLGP